MHPDARERKLAAILSADVVGYSRLMAEDEAATIRTLTSYRKEIHALVGDHRGRVVDATGDNLLAEFPTALDAVECAVEVQRVLRVRNQGLPESRRMLFRIGAHLGDVSVEEDRLYGDGVNIAARLEGLAEPGGICISGNVYDLVHGKLDLRYEDLGAQSVKNIPDPIRVFGIPLDAPPTPSARAPKRGRWWAASTALAAALVAGLVLWRFVEPDFSVPGFDEPAIAVLAFDNLSGDPAQEYFADGIAEDLISRLAAWREIPVIARNSSFVYKGRAVDVKQVSEDLGVRYVVEGSVRRAGDRVRITAQLIDATTGEHVWAESYDRDFSDILAVQDEITRSIVSSMSPELLRTEQRRVARKDPEALGAYDLTMRGSWHLSRFSPAENEKAREFFERAIELDPSNTRAWSGLAAVHSTAIEYHWTDSREESLSELKRAARGCLAQDNQSPDCYWAVAGVYAWEGEQDQFIATYEQAMALAPGNAWLHGWFGCALALAARSEEATQHLETAMRLDPKSPIKWRWMDGMTWAHFAAGRYEEALDWAQQSVRMNPDNEVGYRGVASSSAQLGRIEEARSALAEELRLLPTLTVEEVRRVNTVTEPDFLERWLDGLRKAGLPEG